MSPSTSPSTVIVSAVIVPLTKEPGFKLMVDDFKVPVKCPEKSI